MPRVSGCGGNLREALARLPSVFFIISKSSLIYRTMRYSAAFGPIVSELGLNTWKIFPTKRTFGASLDSLEIALET